MILNVLFANYQSLTYETTAIGRIWSEKKRLKEKIFPKPDCFCYDIVIQIEYAGYRKS